MVFDTMMAKMIILKQKKHIKINDNLDSSVVNHQIIDTPIKDYSAVSKVLQEIHSKETKKNNDNMTITIMKITPLILIHIWIVQSILYQ